MLKPLSELDLCNSAQKEKNAALKCALLYISGYLHINEAHMFLEHPLACSDVIIRLLTP